MIVMCRTFVATEEGVVESAVALTECTQQINQRRRLDSCMWWRYAHVLGGTESSRNISRRVFNRFLSCVRCRHVASRWLVAVVFTLTSRHVTSFERRSFLINVTRFISVFWNRRTIIHHEKRSTRRISVHLHRSSNRTQHTPRRATWFMSSADCTVHGWNCGKHWCEPPV